MMGIATDIQKGAPNIVADPKGKEWHEGFKKGGKAAGEAAFDLITHFAQMKLPKKLVKDYSPGSKVYDNLWYDITKIADRFNDPGKSTTLIGYEWTSVPKGFNLHRNVILRDNGDPYHTITKKKETSIPADAELHTPPTRRPYVFPTASLVVDVLDGKTNRKIWFGVASTPIDIKKDEGNKIERINLTVKKVLLNFPP